MPLALSSSYPLLDIFWTMVEIFLWIIWIWIMISVFIDIFRSHDLSGGAKALWVLFVLVIPLIGVLVYLIVRGGEMHERAAQQAIRKDQLMHSWMQQQGHSSNGAPGGPGGHGPAGSAADQLSKLADLRDRGVISAAEFDREKEKVLA